MKNAYTRAMIRAALTGRLDEVPSAPDPVFRMAVPSICPNVPAEVLQPRNTWSDKAAYDAQARRLAAMFEENFKTFAADVSPEVRSAGPRAS
jgi:phosphoenolpyruvate carboxykinase (ATP)